MNNLYLLMNIISILSSYFHIKYINNYTNIHEYKSLPDLIVDNLPDLSKNSICKNFVDYSILLCFLPIVFNERYDLLRFTYKFFTIIFFLRAFTKFFTVLPSQDNKCVNNVNDPYCYITGYCNDKVFSGHTSLTLTLILLTIENKLIDPKLNTLLIISHIVYVLLILSTKSHYSVDVLVSYIITTSLFYNLKDKL